MFFNPNHVNTKKFHNFLHIMVEHNPHIKLNIYIYISWWIGIYLYENNLYNRVLKNVNIFKRIEMILNFYEICKIYFTCDSIYFGLCL
jgi:exoribonuclease II